MSDPDLCVICHKPRGGSLDYRHGAGWAHWHCLMNQRQGEGVPPANVPVSDQLTGGTCCCRTIPADAFHIYQVDTSRCPIHQPTPLHEAAPADLPTFSPYDKDRDNPLPQMVAQQRERLRNGASPHLPPDPARAAFVAQVQKLIHNWFADGSYVEPAQRIMTAWETLGYASRHGWPLTLRTIAEVLELETSR